MRDRSCSLSALHSMRQPSRCGFVSVDSVSGGVCEAESLEEEEKGKRKGKRRG